MYIPTNYAIAVLSSRREGHLNPPPSHSLPLLPPPALAPASYSQITNSLPMLERTVLVGLSLVIAPALYKTMPHGTESIRGLGLLPTVSDPTAVHFNGWAAADYH